VAHVHSLLKIGGRCQNEPHASESRFLGMAPQEDVAIGGQPLLFPAIF